MPIDPESYTRALHFAATAHRGQVIPGSDYPYVLHPATVAAELIAIAASEPFDVDLAVTCALLHDTVEDTPVTQAEVETHFGAAVASGVAALSKDESLPKEERMADSLRRILQQAREVAMVKLADRIVNLAEPPSYWSRDKRLAYQAEARVILAQLGHASPALATRLGARIERYGGFIPAAPEPEA